MIENLLKDTEVLICVGSGGVGKTTVAATLAFYAAATGKKVIVFTIDPSQRLKTTFNLSLDGQVSEIKHSMFEKNKGKLYASIVNAKNTFDEFVRRAAVKPEIAEKILNNKLYTQLSTTLSGSQEFTALEKLFSTYSSKEYDLIILDTPPTKHAIDFLIAPQKLSQLFNDKITKWFRDPSGEKNSFLTSLFQTGTKQVLKTLEFLTGSEFMKELSDFFVNINSWQGRLEERVHQVHQLLVSQKTKFCLITSFDKAKLSEAEYFAREINKGGYNLNGVIINKCFPLWFESFNNNKTDEKREENFKNSIKSEDKIHDLYKNMVSFYTKRADLYQVFTEKMKSKCLVYQLPELDSDISDIDGVTKLIKYIEDQSLKTSSEDMDYEK